MSLRPVVLTFALLVLVGCQSPMASGYGRVSGVVTAPTTPLGNQIAPAAGETILFIPAAGGQAHVVTTGSGGDYSVDLGAGTYEVRLDGYNPDQFYDGKSGKPYRQWPAQSVVVGREIKLDFIYDNGTG